MYEDTSLSLSRSLSLCMCVRRTKIEDIRSVCMYVYVCGGGERGDHELFAGDGLATSAIPPREVAPLRHETLDDSVEGAALVV